MKYVLLGLIQGLTEFLPVSSSGHLVIFQRLFGLPHDIAFDIAVHLASLLAVIIFFRRELIEIIRWFFVSLFRIATRQIGFIDAYRRFAFFKLGLLLLLSTAITAVIALKYSDQFESLFSSARYAGIFLVLTGVILFLAEAFPKGKKEAGQLNVLDSILIGLAQAAAIAPGLSRSGVTVSTGLVRGLNRQLAARYSFLLSIPTILAAGIFEIKKFTAVTEIWPIIFGSLAAFVSAYFAIGLFMSIISRFSLRIFAYYCLIIGILAAILL